MSSKFFWGQEFCVTSEKAVAKKKKAHMSRRPKRPELISVFISIKHLGVLLLPYPPAPPPPKPKA